MNLTFPNFWPNLQLGHGLPVCEHSRTFWNSLTRELSQQHFYRCFIFLMKTSALSKLGPEACCTSTLEVLACSVAQLCRTLQPHGQLPSRLHCPWDFPGKNTGVGCHALLHGIFPDQGSHLHWQADSLPLSHQGSLRCWQNIQIPHMSKASPCLPSSHPHRPHTLIPTTPDCLCQPVTSLSSMSPRLERRLCNVISGGSGL